jgi:hypothetical protein
VKKLLTAVAIPLVLAGGVATAPPASARPPVHPLSIDLVSISQTKVRIALTCPEDPPARLYVVGTVDGVAQQLAFSEPFHCTERPQNVQLRLRERLERGTVVTEAYATYSGDSGELISVPPETQVVR